jgi:hypothetical protein
MNEPKHKAQTAATIHRRLESLLAKLQLSDLSERKEDRALQTIATWLRDPAAQRLLDIWMASNRQEQAAALNTQMSDWDTRTGMNEAQHGRLEDRKA